MEGSIAFTGLFVQAHGILHDKVNDVEGVAIFVTDGFV